MFSILESIIRMMIFCYVGGPVEKFHKRRENLASTHFDVMMDIFLLDSEK